MSRRALLGAGAALVVAAGAVVAGERTGRLDDAADLVGLDPRRLPAESDDALLDRVVRDQVALVGTVWAVAEAWPELADALAPFVERGRRHLQVLGRGTGAEAGPGIDAETEADAVDQLIGLHEGAERDRARDAIEAVSGEFARNLAAISAGLGQQRVLLGDIREGV